MPLMNARCQRCKRVFPTSINIGGGQAYFRNVKIRCRFCGGMAKLIAEGLDISITGDKVEVLRGRLSPSDLSIIVSTLTPFQNGVYSKDETLRAIEKVLPEIAPEVRTLSHSELVQITLMIVAIIQAQVISNNATIQTDTLITLVREQKALITRQLDQSQQQLDLMRRQAEATEYQSELMRQHLKLLEDNLREATEQQEDPQHEQKPGRKPH